MGHLRLGRLPKTLRWREVVGLIEADPTAAARITGLTVVAVETHLRSLPRNDALTYAFWLLLRIATASRSDTFVQDVRNLELSVTADTSAIALIGEVTDALRERSRGADGHSATSECASLAARRALTETVGTQGRTLFGSTLEDLQSAFRAYSTCDQFSEVAQRSFADFTARLLQSYLDRELQNHVEGSLSEREEVQRAIDLHARQQRLRRPGPPEARRWGVGAGLEERRRRAMGRTTQCAVSVSERTVGRLGSRDAPHASLRSVQ